MRGKDYNLVILHHDEVFETRELALDYLNGYYKPFSLNAEPIMVKYGNTTNPDVILAFGTSDTAPGGYYAIDMTKATEEINELNEVVDSNKEELEYIADVLDGVVKATGLTIDDNKIEDKISYEPDSRDEVIGSAVTIAEALDLLSKYTQKELKDNKLSVEDTKSVKLVYSVNPDGGMILKARVKVSTDGDSDDLNFNNNIIGIKNDGIYAASNLGYDDVRHQLIFTTSGYKNGRFQDDAIVQRIDLGEHTKLVADNDGKTVKLTISENQNTTTISANLQIADRENNILKTSDGKVYVEGIAKNIKYGESTVAAELTAHKNKLTEIEANVEDAAKSAHIEGGQTDTLETLVSTLADGGAKVTGNVRLGSTNSIVVRNGGLEANITVDVDTSTNKLIVTIGNQTITKTLPGVELFESAEYNDANEELIITFKTGNTLFIPIHGIIHTWDTVNSENSPITLTKTVVTGGVDKLSGNIKLRSTDNLIGNDGGRLFVSEQNINNKISVETTRATDAENAIRTSLDTLSNNVQTQFTDVSERITAVQDSVNEESTRAREAESNIKETANHADEVATEAKETVTSLNGTVAELSTSLSTLETTVENMSDSVAEIATLRNNLNTEITNRTNKDTELEGKISTANTAIETEKNRAQTAEETLTNRIAHDISDVNSAITAEQTRAIAAEQANAVRIDELDEKIGAGSEQTLADAKAYTDTKVTAEKTEREAKDVELATAIETATRDAADDATAKANAAETAANTYTDAQVLAEKNRAEAAEATNATNISNLETEVDKKVETVEIVKNSQSDLQYTLKVDGEDVGEINIPKDQFLKEVSYDSGNKQLVFVFETTDGTETVNVAIDDLVDTYTAGNGLKLENNQFSVKLNEDSESYLTVTEEGVKLSGVSDYIDAQVLAEKNRAEAAEATKANAADVYTKTEIDNKGYLTEHQDISNLATIASVESLQETVQGNSEKLVELDRDLQDMKFITEETDTVRMTMVKETGADTRVLSSDVKLKTISGENANIIKSDENGLYATVAFNYDKATNKITFNDGNGSKVFELNNFGILQDAFYDSENKSIVLIVKKDDETTERISIPVGDLVNTWTVKNDANSPIVLTKTAGENGDVLSANVSILNNENNLLVNDNGSLFVDNDSNAHKALWGNEVTSVQGVINILWGTFNDIENIKSDIADLKEDNDNIKDTLSDLQDDLNTQKERITTNENNIRDLNGRMEDVEQGLDDLTNTVNSYEQRIGDLETKTDQIGDTLNTLIQNIGGDGSDLIERIERIEQVLEQLIDFGEYDIQI